MIYICPMHTEIQSTESGQCPKCGMSLVPIDAIPAPESGAGENHSHQIHDKMDGGKMAWYDKFKMSMTMTMGMSHTGLAGREMARLMEQDIKLKFFISLLFTVPIILLSPMGKILFGINYDLPFSQSWLLFLLTTPVYFYAGWIFLYSSYQAFKQRTLNMAVLIAVGITAAYGMSVVLTLLGSEDTFYEAAAMLTTFVLFGHWMEMKSRRGSTDALQALLALVPAQARVWRDGKESLVSTSEVHIGDTLILKPGDKVPVDGEITDGETTIDEALVTGESMPVSKGVGDKVIGGSINQTGAIKFTATKVGKDTAISQIMKMVETAQNSKAPGQRMADKFAGYLVIVAVGAGLITFGAWYFLLGETVLFALTFAISTVVIACPDALGLATPTAVAVGSGIGAKHNILIKDATTLEQTSKIQTVVMDKTGTLTEGKPKVTDVMGVEAFDTDEILSLTAAVEAKSTHPLSQAVLDESNTRGIQVSENVQNFTNLPGYGVEGVVDGKKVLVGTVKLMLERQIALSSLHSTGYSTQSSDGYQNETESILGNDIQSLGHTDRRRRPLSQFWDFTTP